MDKKKLLTRTRKAKQHWGWKDKVREFALDLAENFLFYGGLAIWYIFLASLPIGYFQAKVPGYFSCEPDRLGKVIFTYRIGCWLGEGTDSGKKRVKVDPVHQQSQGT